jgi:hypothetical protein
VIGKCEFVESLPIASKNEQLTVGKVDSPCEIMSDGGWFLIEIVILIVETILWTASAVCIIAKEQIFPAQLNLARTQRDQLLTAVSLFEALGGGIGVVNLANLTGHTVYPGVTQIPGDA